jgi:hypothetical protein
MQKYNIIIFVLILIIHEYFDEWIPSTEVYITVCPLCEPLTELIGAMTFW